MSLREYQKKRHFNKTPEPPAKKASSGGHMFVVQKHDASHLHYDFRLELDGVLKSWAVPKGPSVDPKVKRLAMHVEDHPVAYGSFEGIIPEGEYGGGTVMLWDRGEWEPIDDKHDYDSGQLKFRLKGEKLRGKWMLVRTKQSPKSWLLFKERDEEAKPGLDILETRPRSVATNRTMEQIAADKDWVWNSHKDASKQARSPKPASRNGRHKKPPKLKTTGIDYDFGAKAFAGVRLTSPEKLLWPEEEITKVELAAYYYAISAWMLPHLKDRPIVVVRCPEGRGKECFYQKHPGKGTPDTFRQVPIRESEGVKNYLIVDGVDSLISLAQIGALEIHAWGSREDMLEQPDRLIFDLDPDEKVPWERVVDSARQIRRFLQDLGLESFVKTTGGKGLHLVVPVKRGPDWDEVKVFCKGVADLVVRADPSRYTANMSKAARPGKIYIDYVRNGRGATAIVPFSTRARAGATVSAPLTWDELSPRTRSDKYTIRTLPQRLAGLDADPWEGFSTTRQSLATPMKKVKQLLTT